MPRAKNRDPRVERLALARAAESEAKTRSTLEAVAHLQASGRRVTVTEVARRAGVSTWFCYNKAAVKDAIENAIAEQAESGALNASEPHSTRVTQSGLETDLSLAREEIRQLRKERDSYKQRAQLALGAELDDVSHAELLAAVTQLQNRARHLELEYQAASDRAAAAEQRADELSDELTAARSSLRKMIRPARSG